MSTFKYVCAMYMPGAGGDQKKRVGSLGSGTGVTGDLNRLIWVLGTEHRSSARTNVLTAEPSLQPNKNVYFKCSFLY